MKTLGTAGMPRNPFADGDRDQQEREADRKQP